MSVEGVLAAFRALSPDDQLAVADAISNEFQPPFELTEEVKRMLDERLAAYGQTRTKVCSSRKSRDRRGSVTRPSVPREAYHDDHRDFY
jgi:hypothetical protein